MDSEKDIKSSQPAVEDSEEEENEILEESPCGRWLKRREEVCADHIVCLLCTKISCIIIIVLAM